MNATMTVTTDEVIEELRRRAFLEQDVFGTFVRDGQMTQAEADHKLACTYRAIEIVEAFAAQQGQTL